MTSFGDADPGEAFDPPILSIGDVARRTGVAVAALRNWESRYGFPQPQRSPGGQRRYRESDCALISDVLRRRDGGLSLVAAVAQATAAAAEIRETSIFAGLRRRQPHLAVHLLNKRILLALTRAIEDQCCAKATRPILVAAFQQQRFYQPAQRRWDILAATAEHSVVFADFEQVGLRPGPLEEIPIAPDSPLRREWVLICDAADQPACVVGWELPGPPGGIDAERRFEVVWSVEPQVVRHAARVALDLAAVAVPDLADNLGHRLAGSVAPASPDLVRATGLMERTLDYLTR